MVLQHAHCSPACLGPLTRLLPPPPAWLTAASPGVQVEGHMDNDHGVATPAVHHAIVDTPYYGWVVWNICGDVQLMNNCWGSYSWSGGYNSSSATCLIPGKQSDRCAPPDSFQRNCFANATGAPRHQHVASLQRERPPPASPYQCHCPGQPGQHTHHYPQHLHLLCTRISKSQFIREY